MDKKEESLGIENSDGSQLFGILIGVLVILVTLVLFAVWRRRDLLSPCVLFLGLSDAGKTLLFVRLLHSKFAVTYTSAKENIGDIIVNNTSLRIIDIPGHEGLRQKCLNNFKSSARGLVFIIDSLTIQKNIRDAAEYLYTVLSDSTIRKNSPSILILCNKQDETMAKGPTVIKMLLEKEINILRLTKTSQLEAIDASSSNFFLGKQGKDFEFSDLSSKVDFAESTAIDKDANTSADIQQLDIWLSKNV